MRLAILGSYSTQILAKSIRNLNYDLEIYEADYSQIDLEIINDNSYLYKFLPDFIVIHETSISFKRKYYEVSNFSSEYYKNCISRIENLINKLTQTFPDLKIIYPTLDLSCEMTFGNYFFKIPESVDAQLHYFNYELTQLALRKQNLFLLDINNLIFQFNSVQDSRLVTTADLHFTISFTEQIAISLNKIINALSGKFIKCVILDLDNTLWGGTIGDDGLEGIQLGNLGIGKAFSEFQIWLQSLKKRGIILCVCSKNNEELAKKPFTEHPDMILSLDDITIFKANWDNKVENIQHIKSILNISYDSIVFLDDNVFERDMVKSAISKIIVPELPDDPALYKEYLIKENLFEITNYSEIDSKRTKKYQQEAKRKALQHSSFNIDDYLKSLNMQATFKMATKDIIPRLSQLTQRTNQFNARTFRYDENKMKRISLSKNYLVIGFNLEDKFGNHGLVALVILEILDNCSIFIDTFSMSCRVFNRGFEYFIVNHIKDIMTQRNFKYLVAEWIPTDKNSLINNFYSKLGFKKFKNKKSILNLKKIKLKSFYIKKLDR